MKRKTVRTLAVLFVLFSAILFGNPVGRVQEKILPDGFVYVDTILRRFRPYAREWWHFTPKNEPFPGIYFNCSRSMTLFF